jgi:hypothetical protein
MQKFRLRKRDIGDVEATLMARGAIEITPFPHPQNMNGKDIKYRVSTMRQAPPKSKISREDTFLATQEGHEEGSSSNRHVNGHRIKFPIQRGSEEDIPQD